ASRLRVRRDLVTFVAGGGQKVAAGCLDLEHGVVVGQRWRAAMERGSRLERELIPRDMRRLEGERPARVARRTFYRVTGQAVHQIEVDMRESRAARGADGRAGPSAVVHASERRELRISKALHADRKTIDARFAEGGVAGRIGGAWVRLERDLGVGREFDSRANPIEQTSDRIGGEEARRPAADIDALHLSTVGSVALRVEIAQKRIDVGAFR